MSKHLFLLALGFLATLLLATGITLILWKGGWQLSTEALRIGYLGEALLSSFGLLGLFAAGGLIGHLKSISLKAGPIQADLAGDDEQDGK